MHGKYYNKQIAKRQRITKTTLVVGMDIGSEFNEMCLMDKEGNVLGKYPRIYNCRKGFDYLTKVIEETKKKGFKDVLIAMEPTGHYWRKIAYFAKDRGYEVRFDQNATAATISLILKKVSGTQAVKRIQTWAISRDIRKDTSLCRLQAAF